MEIGRNYFIINDSDAFATASVTARIRIIIHTGIVWKYWHGFYYCFFLPVQQDQFAALFNRGVAHYGSEDQAIDILYILHRLTILVLLEVQAASPDNKLLLVVSP